MQTLAFLSTENTCHVLRSLGPSVTDASPATGVLYDGRQSQCADELGNLPGWSRAAARRRLASIASDNVRLLWPFIQ